MSERLTDVGARLLELTEEIRRLKAPDWTGVMDRAVKALELLAEENRRLRSDSWLEKAAEEVQEHSQRVVGATIPHDSILAILRRHREGA